MRAAQRGWPPWPRFPPPGAQAQPGFVILKEPVAVPHPQPIGTVPELVWHKHIELLCPSSGPGTLSLSSLCFIQFLGHPCDGRHAGQRADGLG